ncbi:mCG123393 [Mus musculus]|nr:mCG123393 [Mus musculus]
MNHPLFTHPCHNYHVQVIILDNKWESQMSVNQIHTSKTKKIKIKMHREQY